jgi:hypothetical protein
MSSPSIRASKDAAFQAIPTAWFRNWMHAELINDHLFKVNIPGDDPVNTFDEWAAYARSNAIVSPIVLTTVIQTLMPFVALPYSRFSISIL